MTRRLFNIAVALLPWIRPCEKSVGETIVERLGDLQGNWIRIVKCKCGTHEMREHVAILLPDGTAHTVHNCTSNPGR